MPYSLRQQVGAFVLDWPRFEWGLRASWLRICNRNERLSVSPDGRGVVCNWTWTSDLHAAKVFPSLGRRLMERALKDWPIGFEETVEVVQGPIHVSFVIGHRGMQRLSNLLATIATIAAQRDVACECIVVEQSEHREIQGYLPPWVRYVHSPVPIAKMPYCRAWTLNVGARVANGELLIFHDNDLLVPKRYAAESWARYQEGFEVINLKRFIFYLEETHFSKIQSKHALDFFQSPTAIMQNAEAGGSLAVSRSAFLTIGGYDESFVGWGGEDNEFWERAQTLRVWPYGFLPVVHLWHPAQPRKTHTDNPTLRHYEQRSHIAVEDRIAELSKRNFGQTECLSVDWKRV